MSTAKDLLNHAYSLSILKKILRCAQDDKFCSLSKYTRFLKTIINNMIC
jgi:hypothetical protein